MPAAAASGMRRSWGWTHKSNGMPFPEDYRMPLQVHPRIEPGHRNQMRDRGLVSGAHVAAPRDNNGRAHRGVSRPLDDACHAGASEG